MVPTHIFKAVYIPSRDEAGSCWAFERQFPKLGSDFGFESVNNKRKLR